jgi:hypothetical protein
MEIGMDKHTLFLKNVIRIGTAGVMLLPLCFFVRGIA